MLDSKFAEWGSLALALVAGVFRSGQLAAKIESNAKDIKDHKVETNAALVTLSNDIKELNIYLRDAATERALRGKN